MLSAPVSNGTYSDLLSELWTQGMTGSDAPEASNANVWTWNVSGQVGAALTDISNSGNTMTAGQGILVYVFDDTDNDGTDDLPVIISSLELKIVAMYYFKHWYLQMVGF